MSQHHEYCLGAHRCNWLDQNSRIVRRKHKAYEPVQELEAFRHRMESWDF